MISVGETSSADVILWARSFSSAKTCVGRKATKVSCDLETELQMEICLQKYLPSTQLLLNCCILMIHYYWQLLNFYFYIWLASHLLCAAGVWSLAPRQQLVYLMACHDASTSKQGKGELTSPYKLPKLNQGQLHFLLQKGDRFLLFLNALLEI